MILVYATLIEISFSETNYSIGNYKFCVSEVGRTIFATLNNCYFLEANRCGLHNFISTTVVVSESFYHPLLLKFANSRLWECCLIDLFLNTKNID